MVKRARSCDANDGWLSAGKSVNACIDVSFLRTAKGYLTQRRKEHKERQQPGIAAIPGGLRRWPPGMAAIPAVKLMPESLRMSLFFLQGWRRSRR